MRQSCLILPTNVILHVGRRKGEGFPRFDKARLSGDSGNKCSHPTRAAWARRVHVLAISPMRTTWGGIIVLWLFLGFACSPINVAFRTILIRHEQALLCGRNNLPDCVASHSVEARMAKWLLRVYDIGGDGSLPLTGEFTGQMLGVHRNAISTAAHTLQKAA